MVGLGGQVVGLALLTLLMHPHSPMSLPTSVFDDSTGLRTRLYWSQLIVIALVTPLSFVLNKLWTFAAVRTGRPDLADPLREEEVMAGGGCGPDPRTGAARDALTCLDTAAAW